MTLHRVGATPACVGATWAVCRRDPACHGDFGEVSGDIIPYRGDVGRVACVGVTQPITVTLVVSGDIGPCRGDTRACRGDVGGCRRDTAVSGRSNTPRVVTTCERVAPTCTPESRRHGGVSRRLWCRATRRLSRDTCVMATQISCQMISHATPGRVTRHAVTLVSCD